MAKIKKPLRALIPRKPSAAKPKPTPSEAKEREERERKELEAMERGERGRREARAREEREREERAREVKERDAKEREEREKRERERKEREAREREEKIREEKELEKKKREEKPKPSEKLERAEKKDEKEEDSRLRRENLETTFPKEEEEAGELEEAEVSGENIETIIDRVVEYVKSKERANIHEVAKALAIKPEQIERLLNVLEESGLVSVRYSITGTADLVAKKSVVERIELVKAKKECELMREAIKHAEMEVKDSEETLEFMEKEISRRLGIAEKLLDTVKSQESGASGEDLRYLMKEAHELEMTLEKFNIGMKTMRGRVFNFAHKVREFESATEAVKPTGAAPLHPSLINTLLSPFGRIKRLFARRSS